MVGVLVIVAIGIIHFISRVFYGSREFFRNVGLKPIASNLLALLVAILVIGVII